MPIFWQYPKSAAALRSPADVAFELRWMVSELALAPRFLALEWISGLPPPPPWLEMRWYVPKSVQKLTQKLECGQTWIEVPFVVEAAELGWETCIKGGLGVGEIFVESEFEYEIKEW